MENGLQRQEWRILARNIFYTVYLWVVLKANVCTYKTSVFPLLHGMKTSTSRFWKANTFFSPFFTSIFKSLFLWYYGSLIFHSSWGFHPAGEKTRMRTTLKTLTSTGKGTVRGHPVFHGSLLIIHKLLTFNWSFYDAFQAYSLQVLKIDALKTISWASYLWLTMCIQLILYKSWKH